MTDKVQVYPGELATAEQMLELADQYRIAANVLRQLGRPGKPLTLAPFRLSAIQAVELYLNALLLRRGNGPDRIRGFRHDLVERTELAVAAGLRLRLRTAAHLRTLSQSREYLVTRYGPEMVSTTSDVTRLTATLNEVAGKVTLLLSRSCCSEDPICFKTDKSTRISFECCAASLRTRPGCRK